MGSSYDRLTVDNPSLIKRISHRKRFQLALKLLDLQEDETILDYGTGDARLLMQLCQLRIPAHIMGYEPVPEMQKQALDLLQQAGLDLKIIDNREDLACVCPDKLSCLEVLEHLDEQTLPDVFQDFRELLKPGSILVVSVPIEVGLTALVKNSLRAIASQSHRGTRFSQVLSLTFGNAKQVPRISENGYIESHLGFDYRRLRTRIEQEGFVIEKELYSPLPWLRSLLNSQIFWLCRRA